MIAEVEKCIGVQWCGDRGFSKMVKTRRECKRAIIVEWAATALQGCTADTEAKVAEFAQELALKMKDKGMHE